MPSLDHPQEHTELICLSYALVSAADFKSLNYAIFRMEPPRGQIMDGRLVIKSLVLRS
jgi:hypothetical protein